MKRILGNSIEFISMTFYIRKDVDCKKIEEFLPQMELPRECIADIIIRIYDERVSW